VFDKPMRSLSSIWGIIGGGALQTGQGSGVFFGVVFCALVARISLIEGLRGKR
jgi:hypothetical protein